MSPDQHPRRHIEAVVETGDNIHPYTLPASSIGRERRGGESVVYSGRDR